MRTRFPDDMQPTAFVLLETLPLTPHGKRDLAALPPPDDTNTLRNHTLSPPDTPTEKQLAAMVAPLLKLTQVSIDDNFFRLAGHSLLETQLLVNIATSFGVNLSVRSLFNAPTIRDFARDIVKGCTEKIEAISEDDVQHFLQWETASYFHLNTL